MNAMTGNAGEYTRGGKNVNNPGYTQFFKLSQILQPTAIFLFLDEHPDSINDGYFLNRDDSGRWMDLPASYHNGAANFAFADGHAEKHLWRFPSTKPAPQPDAASLPFVIPPKELGDFDWLMNHTSTDE
jgi:prepilin-type processing-associated H-X9-DG protein